MSAQHRTIVTTFGRMNPVTRGHAKLINAVLLTAKHLNADHMVFLSQTHDSKKNPLSWDQKIAFMRRIFPRVNFGPKIPTIPAIFNHLTAEGYDAVTIVVGSDRTSDLEEIVHAYRAAYERREHREAIAVNVYCPAELARTDAADTSGISGTKMREFVRSNDYTSFVKFVPSTNTALLTQLYHAVQQGLGVAAV